MSETTWWTERLVGDAWRRVARWGHPENAKDSAAFLASLLGIETRVVSISSKGAVTVIAHYTHATPEQELPR